MIDRNGNPILPNRCYAYIDSEGFGQELYLSREVEDEIFFVEDQYDCDRWADPVEVNGVNAESLAPYLQLQS